MFCRKKSPDFAVKRWTVWNQWRTLPRRRAWKRGIRGAGSRLRPPLAERSQKLFRVSIHPRKSYRTPL